MINGDNKETLAVLHGMGILKDNGVYCGVLKEGVFFDGKFKDLRKNLVENYNVQYVISIPQSDFWNTSTKTSILIFKNDKQITKEIKFCELKELIEDGDNIGVQEINPETKQVIREFISSNYEWNKKEGEFLTVSYDDIVSKDYTFNFKNFIKQDIKVGKGFKIVKLGDIIIYKPKSNRKAGDENDKGIYTFYTSSEKVKKCNFLDFKDELCIIIGTGGKGSLFLDKNFSCSADNFVCITDNDNLTTYLYYYLKFNWDKFLYKMFNGSTLGHINKESLNNYEIPIPENIETIKLYLDYLQPANETLQTLQTLQTQKEASICGKIKLLTSMGNEGVDYNEYKLVDICKVKAGQYLKNYNKEKKKNSGFPIIGGGSISGYIDKYTHENEWVIHKDGVSSKIISYINSKFFINHHGWSITLNDDKLVSMNYLGYWIMSNTETYLNIITGSNQKGLNQDTFYDFNIRILKPTIITKYKLDEDFEFMDKLKNDIQNTLKIQEETTKQMMSLVLNHTSSDEKVESNEELFEKPIETSDNEDENETIEYKGKNYLIEGDKVYNINEDDTKGKLFGNYIDGKVKKIKTSDILVV
jgi:restriction endonuclease S subunit